MNQNQRKFLIDRIEKEVAAKTRALNDSKPREPNLQKYIVAEIMRGSFVLRSNEEIRATIEQYVLDGNEGNLMGSSSRWGSDGNIDPKVTLLASEIFILPDNMQKRYDEYKETVDKIDKEIRLLRAQSEGLITRIQLAPDARLQKMIDEVSDMGDLSLMDIKLREVGPATEQKKLR